MSQPAIEIKDLHKRYGSVHALRGINLSVPEGPVGLLGPNGAGKTTLLKLLLGMLEPDGGSAEIAGQNPIDKTQRLAIRQRVGYMPESNCLIPGMSAVELVGLLGRLTGMPKNDAMTRAHEVLDYVGSGEERYRKSEEHSTGMKQRIKLAQALVHDPPILLLDEPTNGLDPGGRKELLELVSDLGRNQGKHVLLCTHLLPDVERTCDHVIVLNQGQVVQQESILKLTEASASTLHVGVRGEVERWIAHLEGESIAANRLGPEMLEITMPPGAHSADQLFLSAAQCGTAITGLTAQRASLEDAFLAALDQHGVQTELETATPDGGSQ